MKSQRETKRPRRGRSAPAKSAIALFSVQKKPGLPLYVQLFQEIKKAIANGRLKTGTRLPSTRKLREELGISRNTTAAAIELLFSEGLVEGRVGSGTFVTALPARPVSTDEALLDSVPDHTPRRISQAASSLLTGPVDVVRGGYKPFEVYPAFDQFPFATWERLTISRLRSSSRKLYLHGEVAGLQELREAIAVYVRELRDITCDPSQIVITSGATQALDLTARLLIDPGDVVFVENPTEPRVRSTLRLAGADVVSVPIDRDGIDVSSVKEMRAKFVHLTSSSQYPLGMSLSPIRRFELQKWVNENDSYIVEFDIGGEFWFSDMPIKSDRDYAASGRTIYIGTFSQVLIPAIRIGYLILPHSLVDAALRIRSVTDRHLPILLQATLADFIADGYMGRHLARMKRVYSRRLRALCDAVRKRLGDLVEILGIGKGLHIVLQFKVDVDDVRVAQIAKGWGIVVHPLSNWYEGGEQRRGLIIGIGTAQPDRLDSTIQEVRHAIDDAMYEQGERSGKSTLVAEPLDG